jgi:hypothetical protein
LEKDEKAEKKRIEKEDKAVKAQQLFDQKSAEWQTVQGQLEPLKWAFEDAKRFKDEADADVGVKTTAKATADAGADNGLKTTAADALDAATQLAFEENELYNAAKLAYDNFVTDPAYMKAKREYTKLEKENATAKTAADLENTTRILKLESDFAEMKTVYDTATLELKRLRNYVAQLDGTAGADLIPDQPGAGAKALSTDITFLDTDAAKKGNSNRQ